MKENKNKIIIITVVSTIVVFVSIVAFYTCYHKWDNATCVKPQTCRICGKTKGEELGHKWKGATCIEPKTCIVCNKTKEKELGHAPDGWATIKEATCSMVGEKEAICKRCGKSLVQEIPMIEHTAGEWKVIKDYKVNRDGTVTAGTQAVMCSVCDTKLESKEYTIELTIGQKNAVIRAYEEENFWHVSRDYLINNILVEYDYFSVEDATFAVDHMDVDFDEQAVLYARENLSGESKGGITEMMRYYGFTEKQINYALEQVGF